MSCCTRFGGPVSELRPCPFHLLVAPWVPLLQDKALCGLQKALALAGGQCGGLLRGYKAEAVEG